MTNLTPIKGGLLGAGLGSRLKQESHAKPLALLAGKRLIDRAVDQFFQAGINSVTCALRAELLDENDRASLPKQENLDYLFVNTDSSLHTLDEVVKSWKTLEEPALLMMVDTILRKEDLAAFLHFCRGSAHGTSAVLVTPHVDDEKPLWVHQTQSGDVLQFGGSPSGIATSGVYFLQPDALRLVSEEVQRGTSKMRNYLSNLVQSGNLIKTFVVEKTIDVDHPSDLVQAEMFLRER